MPIDPAEIAVGRIYRTESGEERLIWTIRSDGVCYFARASADTHWSPGHAPTELPTVESFATTATGLVTETRPDTPVETYVNTDGDW